MTINYGFIIVQGIIILLLIVIAIWLIRVNNLYHLEKRYNRFTLKPFKDNRIPIFDRFYNLYISIQRGITKFLNKRNLFKDYSKKYSKYILKTSNSNKTSMDFISTKIVYSFLLLIPISLSDIVRSEPFTLYKFCLFLLIGFFIPDIYWKITYTLRSKQIEKDMLKAVIIMNNSFKSGLSIMQAIYMVSNELEGPIADEFRKMYLDISFGLDMDLVFKRFSERVKTEEANYISTSLSVLNKTGGNIVQVFASVERSAFNRKKLKDELNSMSASSKLIFWILVSLPIFMAVAIVVVQFIFSSDPGNNYFAPLITTGIGRIILFLILGIYISYILVIRKIVYIKE